MADDKDDLGPTAAAVLANPDLDPELASRLNRWFGDDASTEVTETGPAPNPYAAQERIDTLLSEAADAELVDRLDRDHSITLDYAKLLPPLAAKMRSFEATVRLQLRVPELYTAELPHDIEDLLTDDNTPQALLRDLHRLDWEFDLYIEEEVFSIQRVWDSPQKEAIDAAMNRKSPKPVDATKYQAFTAVHGIRDIVRTPCGVGKP